MKIPLVSADIFMVLLRLRALKRYRTMVYEYQIYCDEYRHLQRGPFSQDVKGRMIMLEQEIIKLKRLLAEYSLDVLEICYAAEVETQVTIEDGGYFSYNAILDITNLNGAKPYIFDNCLNILDRTIGQHKGYRMLSTVFILLIPISYSIVFTSAIMNAISRGLGHNTDNDGGGSLFVRVGGVISGVVGLVAAGINMLVGLDQLSILKFSTIVTWVSSVLR